MKIPVIGTAIVNGVHWLQRLLDSVDYPVENFVIFNNNGKGEITEELDKIASIMIQYLNQTESPLREHLSDKIIPPLCIKGTIK